MPLDPAAVAGMRETVCQKLDEWGLSELGFSTELVLSELIADAMRYGSEPIHVRLIRDRTAHLRGLSDSSSTSPHLRYAATMDEGGRGLFLVSRIRPALGHPVHPQARSMWAEQALPRSAGSPARDRGRVGRNSMAPRGVCLYGRGCSSGDRGVPRVTRARLVHVHVREV